jgi:hypothetical protein
MVIDESSIAQGNNHGYFDHTIDHCFAARASAASASNWEQFQFDSNHSGVTPDDGPLYSPKLVWKQYT